MDLGTWKYIHILLHAENQEKHWKMLRFFCSDLEATEITQENIQTNLDYFYEFNGATFVPKHALDQEFWKLPWICLCISGQKSTPSVLRDITRIMKDMYAHCNVQHDCFEGAYAASSISHECQEREETTHT